MDYKQIDQLLERYWQCETTLEEENRLREFFRNDVLSSDQKAYKDIFVYQSLQQEVEISPDFEKRLFAAIGETSCKIKKVSFVTRVAPLFRAAVFVGIFLMVSNLTKHSLFKEEEGLGCDFEETSSTPVAVTEAVNKPLVQCMDTIIKIDTIPDITLGLK